MPTYKNKEDLIVEIEKTAKLFISEFDAVNENDKNKHIEGVDRTPGQMIAYQLGWMNLVMSWDKDELEGKEVITPAYNYKWNKLGGLYEKFYKEYEEYSLFELKELFSNCTEQMIIWINNFSNDELFTQDIRKWASSTPSKWPIWKWVHINTVAPFKTFRTKIRKWKKLNSQ
ncbi:ClbS/DfsB family four-helix bundle protein [Alkaliphilus transvaalensis]|uniref:ClbS/DfsB family four-helix bundle protein n=1 Tax=Alkaliphilus transvaalensis TaxID=114628 RepID=UPI00047AC3A8|nr:ClbS/DfsB family four-helix bundle protein [Alkaliphilus transvaalensis]